MSGNFPREVVIVESENEWSHHYPVGTVVTLTKSYGASGAWAKGAADFGLGMGAEAGTEQVIQFQDFEEIEKPREKLVAKRVKMVYTVQDSDGDIIYFTQDRTLAREVKAEEGGKANGIVIMQYAEVKEVR